MSVSQYIGARYVPLFAEPAEWNAERTYEPLTIVLHEGNSYTSKQFVPRGADIDDDEFWALTGNYNSQVEQYRREVKSLDGRTTANEQAISRNASDISKNEQAISRNASDISRNEQAISRNASDISSNEQAISRNASDISRNEQAISRNASDISKNEQAISRNASNISKNEQAISRNAQAIDELKSPIAVIYGDSWSDFTESESNWTNLVAKQLGCIRKNYSKAGATITDIGEKTIKTLTDEVDESISELNGVSERVKYIFILMGVNDITHDKTDGELLTTLAQQLTRVRDAFPKALISFSFNFPCYSQSKYMPHVNYFKSFAFNRGYRYVDLGSLMFAPALYKADRLHPTNGAGTGYIAGRMLGSQTDVIEDDYIIKNDDEALCSIIYTPHGAILNAVFKTAKKISLGDMQVKLVNSTLGTSVQGAVVLTTDAEGNYITALNSLSVNTAFKSPIYA